MTVDGFKGNYAVEYTGEKLPAKLVQEAIIDELTYFCEVVWEGVDKKEASQEEDLRLIRTRRVPTNKGGDREPGVRARLVATEVGKERTDLFSSSTPPRGKADLSLQVRQ